MNELRIPTILLLGTLLLLVTCGPPPSYAACRLNHCKNDASRRTYITNTHRQIIGDLYNPGAGRRTQIRDTNRRILGYIERSGRITNTHRQKIGEVNGRYR